MDISTGLSLAAGAVVLCTLILMGGDLRMFVDAHAAIVIFGGSFAATLIRFPLNSMFHGLPLGAKFAFTMRRMTQREMVDEIASLAEIARKQGPIGLEKVEVEDPFLAKVVAAKLVRKLAGPLKALPTRHPDAGRTAAAGRLQAIAPPV